MDFSRDTDSGTMMNGKITRSLSGSTGRTSGILIASSFAVSFASVISTSHDCGQNHCALRCNGCSRGFGELSARSSQLAGRYGPSSAVSCELRAESCELHLRASFQSVQLLHKCVDVLEAAVDRRKSDVRDSIEVAQTVHHQSAERLRRDLALGRVGHGRLDGVGDPLELRLRDGAFATGDLQPAHQLFAVIRLAPLIAFHHLKRRQLDLLVTGETAL